VASLPTSTPLEINTLAKIGILAYGCFQERKLGRWQFNGASARDLPSSSRMRSVVVSGLDTHAVVKELLAAGFTDIQAETLTGALRKTQDIDLSSLATKSDLAAQAAVIKSDLAALAATSKADLSAGLSETKADIVKWMFGAIGVQTLVMLGAVLSLIRLGSH
jgi:hypothetical protein